MERRLQLWEEQEVGLIQEARREVEVEREGELTIQRCRLSEYDHLQLRSSSSMKDSEVGETEEERQGEAVVPPPFLLSKARNSEGFESARQRAMFQGRRR